MRPEIADIYFNSDRLSTIDRAKLYPSHVCQLFEEIERLDAKILELERRNRMQSADPIARKTVDEIIRVIEENGYNGVPG
jgi:AraC-like DNA-binding protein